MRSSRPCRWPVLRSGICGHDSACSPDTRDATVASRDTEGGALVRLRRILGVAAAGFALTLGAAACGSDNLSDSESDSGSSESESKGELVVGSAGFTEINIMAEMYAALLQDAGYDATVQTVQNRELYEPALESGDIDVVPDYAATMTEFLNRKVNGPDAAVVATSDVETTVAALQELAEPLGLTALEPAQAVDQNAFVVSQDFATQNNLKTLSDLGASGLTVSLAAGEECATRPFCQLGLEQTYGIKISRIDPLGVATVPTKQSVQEGRNQLGLALTTDGTLEDFGLVVLEDDKGLQLADNLIPIVNTEQAGAEDIATALNQLADVLTTEDLAAMNKRVDSDREREADVAQSYLEEKGLLQS